MNKPFDINAGGWWRFRRYEIRDGYIRPILRSKSMFYDPWKSYRKSWDQDSWLQESDESFKSLTFTERREKGPAYVSLLNLINEINPKLKHGKGLYELTKEHEAKLIEWCSQNGLIGILPHQALMITLAPRAIPKFGPFARGYKAGDLIQPEDVATGLQTVYLRSNHTWQHQNISYLSSQDAWTDTGVWLQELRKNKWKYAPLKETVGRFFPDVPEDQREIYDYPMPLTEEFWREYAEPVDAFITGALTLREALINLKKSKPTESETEKERAMVLKGMETLNALVGAISVSIIPMNDGSFNQYWIAPSLLSSYALMALHDLTSGKKRLLICENSKCRRFFGSDKYQALYCSEPCRWAVDKRKYRSKLKGITTS